MTKLLLCSLLLLCGCDYAVMARRPAARVPSAPALSCPTGYHLHELGSVIVPSMEEGDGLCHSNTDESVLR